MCDCKTAQHLAACLRDGRRPFTHLFDNRIGRDAQGLYAFWLGACCLYVGMSTKLRRRMHQHRVQEHNSDLDRYFKAFWADIEVSFVPLAGKSESELRAVERDAIRWLRPRTNKIHALH